MTSTTDRVLQSPTSTDNAAEVRPHLNDVQLRDIIKTIPKEYFQKNPLKAWSRVLISLVSAIVGYAAIALSPWYLLPLAWIWTGTTLTGWFVIGHDCGHRSFANRRWVNDLVGHIAMLPLIYPFHSWRIKHDYHHTHTNKQAFDNAWDPWTVETYEQSGSTLRWLYERMRGRFWWLGSIAHWFLLHFTPSKYKESDRNKIRFSASLAIIFAAILFPTLIATVGIWGFVKFWVMPWLVYHFWMSTLTLVHHTTMGVQFKPEETWSAAEAQLSGTIHCNYPKWVEIICHDINVHVPHHVSVGIPSYNLRKAYASLQENWGEYIQPESDFTWSMMKSVVDHTHLYHAENAYQSFASYKQSTNAAHDASSTQG